MNRLRISYYFFQASFQLLFWVPFFYQIQKNAGLSDSNIFAIQTIYYLSFALFELPTGYISDRLGNKLALIIAASLMIAANLLPVFSLTAPVFFIHFLMIALSRSFFSGASQALLYNELQALSLEKEFKVIEGNSRFYSLVSRTIAWALGGYIIALNPKLIYLLTAVSASIALFSAFAMKQTKKIETKERVNPLQLLKDGLLKDENLRWALIQGTGIFVTVRIIQVNLYQPILLDKGFSVASLGLIMSAMTVAESFGSKFTGEFSEKFGLIRGSFLSILAVCISMISFAYSISYLAIVNFIVFSFFIGISMPLARQILNDNIKTSEARATVLSFESLFNRLLSAAVTMPIAYLIEHHSMYLYTSTISVLAAILAYAVYIHLDTKEQKA